MIAQVQTDPALVEQLSRIATALTVLTVVAVVVVVAAVAGLALSYGSLKRLGRTLQSLDKVIDELAPRAEPLIDGLTNAAVDVSAVTESVRRKVNDVMATVEDLNGQLREVSESAEQRIRQFGAVLDVVQAEAEDMMLEAASTARGLNTAAKALREPSPQSRGTLPRLTEEVPDDD
jgi:ABC-type transporter Mla subunit MlaD